MAQMPPPPPGEPPFPSTPSAYPPPNPPGFPAPGYPVAPGYGPPGYPVAPGFAPPGYPPPGYPVPGGWGMPQAVSRYGGFWIRFGAYVIDSILVGIVFGILIRVTSAVTVTCPAGTVSLNASCPGGVTAYSGAFYVLLLLALAYYVVLWAFGGTLGQRMLGLKVVDATSGQCIGIPRSILRMVGFAIAAIPIYLGLMWAGWDPRKQGWHDKIAATVVIRS